MADEYLSEAVHYFLWNKTGEISGIYSILNTSIVAYRSKNARTELELRNECEAFKQYAIRYDVASVSCAYYPVLFCDILDDNISLAKFSNAVGIMIPIPKYPDIVMDLWDSPQDPDCESLGSIHKFLDAFAIPTHAEKPKVVDAELFQNIWRIN